MIDPFEFVFTNIMFFYPAFRSEDNAQRHYGHFLKKIEDAVSGNALGKRGMMIYLHIPFCRNICRFCGYHRQRLTRQTVPSTYVDRLLNEIQRWSNLLDGRRLPISHIYVGGGTPTLLAASDFLRLVEKLHNAFALSEKTEFDMESDVASLQDPNNLELYRKAGVKRISFGVQSFDERVRKMADIDRKLGSESLDRAIDCLRQTGYGINYDLMFGLPGQSAESFLSDVRKSICDIVVDHLDLLEFFPHPEAYFTRRFDEFRDLTAAGDDRRKMYSKARGLLLKNGFAQQTLTDFWQSHLKPSPFKTLLYRNADILGLGAGSHGILHDCAYRNSRLDEGYLNQPRKELPLAFIRPMSPSLFRTRSLVLLPKLLSFRKDDFRELLTTRERVILHRWVNQGRLREKEGAYCVTEAGMLRSAEMMLEVIRAGDA